MTLPELSIRRHVLAWMLSAILVLFGFISYQRIGVDRFPYIEFPIVSITTALKGANPEIVDASITNVIETAVNSVPGIDHIQSTSSPGVSVVTITRGSSPSRVSTRTISAESTRSTCCAADAVHARSPVAGRTRVTSLRVLSARMPSGELDTRRSE